MYDVNKAKQHEQKLQQAKKKLKIKDQNPFDAKLQKKQEIRQKRQNNQDQTQKEDQIRQYISQQKQQEITEHNDAQKVYLEIMQKSKQAKKERQQIKQEVERKFQSLDNQIASYLDDMMPRNQQKTNKLRVQFEIGVDQMKQTIEGQTKVYANTNNGTLEQQVQIAQQNLQKLQQKHDQEGGDDIQDDQFEQLTNNIEEYGEEETEEMNEDENEIEDLADQQNMHNFSENLKNMPYILPVPEQYEDFIQQLESVLPNEEIIVLDRIIKQNSTFVNRENQAVVERLTQFCLNRFDQLCSQVQQLNQFITNDQTLNMRLNSIMRILQYLMKEVKGYIILQIRNQLGIFVNQFILSNKQNYVTPQLILYLRLYQLLLFQPSYDCNTDNQQVVIIQNYLEILENIDLLKLLMIQSFIQNQFSGSLLNNLLNLQESQQKQKLLSLYIRFWKISPELLNTQYQQLNYIESNEDIDIYEQNNQIIYNKNINLLKKQVYSIQQVDPLYMLNFNPKYSRNESIERVKQLAKAKSEKRKEKDKFRRQIKEIRAKQQEDQNKRIEREIEQKQQRIKQIERNWSLK